ncbi:hypothetical protein N7540_006568 [Penicillium herquei]|nr:hypothetical protein N7540_006568 [Penicillium herquei]
MVTMTKQRNKNHRQCQWNGPASDAFPTDGLINISPEFSQKHTNFVILRKDIPEPLIGQIGSDIRDVETPFCPH